MKPYESLICYKNVENFHLRSKTRISTMRNQPHYIRKHVFGLAAKGEHVSSLFLIAIMLENISPCFALRPNSSAAKKNGRRALKARKFVGWPVGYDNAKLCYGCEVIFFEDTRLCEQAIITSFPVY